MTGIARFWRNWAGYCCLDAWAGIITLDVAVVFGRVRRAICPRSVAFDTLGGGGPTVCGTLELLSCATGSKCSLIAGIIGADGEALGFWMTTLGSKPWGWTVVGRRIEHIIERRCVCVCGGVVTCSTFARGSVG